MRTRTALAHSDCGDEFESCRRGDLNANHDALAGGTKNFAESWSLDMTGNWSTYKKDDDGNGTWELDQARAHNAANEISQIAGASTHVAHDRAGNMTRVPKPSDATQYYACTYDAWNRLVKLQDGANTVAEYKYDGAKRRIIKKSYSGGSLTETRHLYFTEPSQWQVIEERVGSNTNADRQFVWGLRYVDDLVLRDRNADSNVNTGSYGKSGSGLEERLYALQDANWNVTALSNASGTIQERYAYSAYGTPIFLTSAFASRSSSNYDWETLYCGYRFDTLVGLYHIRHRVYRPDVNWLCRDPLWYSAGVNLYLYGADSPSARTDATGAFSEPGSSSTPPGSEAPPVEPGRNPARWPPAPDKNPKGKCNLRYCQSDVLGGVGQHTFTLLYVPGLGWVYYRGGPANNQAPFGNLVCTQGPYTSGSVDYPKPGNPDHIKCKAYSVPCKSPDDLNKCFSEVCRRINTGQLPYEPIPLPAKGGNCNTLTSWLYSTCIKHPHHILLPPRPARPTPGIILCPVPKCVSNGFPPELKPE